MIESLLKPIYKNLLDSPCGGPSVNNGKGIWMNCNENPEGVSEKALEAMEKAIHNVNLYPEPTCIELKEKLAAKYGVRPENIAVANGSSGIIDTLGTLFSCDGDETIFCQPTFMIYNDITVNNGGTAKILPLTKEMYFDDDAMAEAINEKTKMVMICNPNNPTGCMVPKEKLFNFLEKLPDNVIALIDEAYIDFAEETKSDCTAVPFINKKNVVVVRTFSKISGLAGVRIGYAIANEKIIGLLNRRLMTFNVNKVALAGACGLLDDIQYLDNSYKHNAEGRKYLSEELEKLGFKVYESQTNFIYCTVEGIDVVKTNENLLANDIHINMRPEQIRISIGNMEQNKIFINTLKKSIVRL